MRLSKLLVTLSLLTSLASAAPVSGTLTGRIVDWPAGQTGEVTLESDVVGRVATGTIDAQGTFRLALPAKLPKAQSFATVSYLFKRDPKNAGDPCTRSGTGAPATARYHFFRLEASQNGRRLGDLTLGDTDRLFVGSGDRRGRLLFASAPFKVKSTINCPAFTDRVDGQFAAGWNLAVRKVTQVTPLGVEVSTLTNTALPAGLSWRLFEVMGGIGISVGSSPDGRVMIEAVRAGGTAERAGLRAGDTVVTLAGQDVTKVPLERVARLVQGRPGTKVTIGVRRTGSPEVLRFVVDRMALLVP